MWMVPVEARRMVRRDVDLIVLRPARWHVEEHIIGVASRRHGHSVRVQVCLIVQSIDEVQPDDIAGVHAQGRRYVAAVVHRGEHWLPCDVHPRSSGGERQREDAVATRRDRRVAKHVTPSRAGILRFEGDEEQRQRNGRAHLHCAPAAAPMAPNTVNGALPTLPNPAADATSVYPLPAWLTTRVSKNATPDEAGTLKIGRAHV